MPLATVSHLELEWHDPEYRAWYERLSQERMLVRYDGRGTGLSQRDVTHYSLDAWVLDLEAMVDRLALESFALFALAHSGPVAIAYAVRHPEQVSPPRPMGLLGTVLRLSRIATSSGNRGGDG